jgi:hypothetical protein
VSVPVILQSTLQSARNARAKLHSFTSVDKALEDSSLQLVKFPAFAAALAF